MSYVNTALNQLNSFIVSLDTTGWAILGAVLVTFGVLCMQGYGSRANY